MECKHADKCEVKGEWQSSPCTCDTYHTFDELYDHRITLYIALCRQLKGVMALAMHDDTSDIPKHKIWRSRFHDDGQPAFGGTWFVLGINQSKGKQVTYHLPIERWEETNFAETLVIPPKWDGHTSGDVLERLKEL